MRRRSRAPVTGAKKSRSSPFSTISVSFALETTMRTAPVPVPLRYGPLATTRTSGTRMLSPRGVHVIGAELLYTFWLIAYALWPRKTQDDHRWDQL